MQKIKGMNWTMAVVGVWVASGVAFALWNDLIVGVAVVVLGTASALTTNETSIKTMDWITAALGLWLVLAPFILGYSAIAAALWSDIIAGVIILALSVWVERELPQVVRQTS